LIETTRASQAYDGVFHPDVGVEDAVERKILRYKIWLHPRDSNPDMLIQSHFTGIGSKENKTLSSAESGKVLQIRNTRATRKTANQKR
jgi:hypothetical protein